MTGSAAKEIAKFIVLAAKAVGRTMFFEATHTSDPSFNPAMILFQPSSNTHSCDGGRCGRELRGSRNRPLIAPTGRTSARRSYQ
jgi:hypothetical protein